MTVCKALLKKYRGGEGKLPQPLAPRPADFVISRRFRLRGQPEREPKMIGQKMRKGGAE